MSVLDETAISYEDRHCSRFLAAIGSECAAQRDRLILWVPVLLGLGIGLYFSLAFEPPAFVAAGFLVVLCAGLVLAAPVRAHSLQTYATWLTLGAAFIVLLGFCTAQWRTHMLAAPILERERDPVTVQGRVVGIDKLEEGTGVRLILDRLLIEDLAPAGTPARVRIKVRQETNVTIGDTVSLLAGLKPPSAPVAPGAFDFQRYAYFKGIGAFGFAYRAPEVIDPGPAQGGGQRLEHWRQGISAKIERALDYPAAAIAIALMTGERAGIAEEDWQALRDAGLAHMLAISGLHVGLIATVVFMAVRFLLVLWPPLALHHPVKKYAAVAALLAALSYTLIVGATIPTIRALLMTGVVLIAIMLDRMPFSMRLVALAATAVLLFLPESLLGASFQMSFAAVASLIFCYEALRPYLSDWYRQTGIMRRIALYFLGVCLTTVIASIATGPFSLFHFQHFAVHSLQANLFAVPLMAFIVMPFAVISYVLMPLGFEGPGLFVMGMGIDAVLGIAHTVAGWQGASWTPPVMPLAAFLCIIGGALFVMLWQGRARYAGLSVMALSLLFIELHQPPAVLVSSSGQLIALRDSEGGLAVQSLRRERFAAEIWARRNGVKTEDLGRWKDSDYMNCDEWGCRAEQDGRRIAIALHTAAQEEDCAWADILISPEPLRVRSCRAETAIGRFDLWRDGAHAVWLDGTVKSVASARGTRPWTVSNRR